ncbi:RND transporter [Rickettsia conorii subsp. heilongjiangensis]|uniref:RND transporter n=1 Tax=Rickettsia conorii subsp. heilongjiangensis TaxID=226665 RepID=A0AAD1GID4_RICCR|nr:RND transporter [Rickettsia conorii subsp. heilongjiangensis]BBM92429.1 RND transporter [Rickettsia conorii subsp. heilongjiangensis]BBM93638.1 RND transporter [Rickettsia conorii subsp. heilongjiangensis]BBM94847.1 RND transporter [Rickettsia conorii subsp. heilongjiangensis]
MRVWQCLRESVFSSLRGKTASFDEAISGVCYYFMRLPRSLRLLAMTT